jgi:hypothetical protein
MALSEDVLKLQLDILASKTSDNPDMVFKKNATLNKGLNPDYFSGQYTKIVNALNQLADSSNKANIAVTSFMDKMNNILLDTSNEDNSRIFEQLQLLMEAPTIIEGMQNMLQGNTQEQLLNLKQEDIGKFLTVGKTEDNKLVLKAIDLVLNAESIEYTNEFLPEVHNVKEALDHIVEEIQSPLEWEDVDHLVMKDSEIEDIIDDLNM